VRSVAYLSLYDPRMSSNRFASLLDEQIAHEFAASQQYVAIAAYYDGDALPQLAAHFYRQAIEERNHAMMIVQYLMDADLPVTIPGIAGVRNAFATIAEPVGLALDQERRVSAQIAAIAGAARDERDFMGEQFMQWFLKEQVEEVASMTTLLRVVERAGDNALQVEEYLARENATEAADPTAPRAAGGAL
jgi:bacterioferritin B